MNSSNIQLPSEANHSYPVDASAFPEFEARVYHCCAEFHLAALSPVCALIHPFALRIAHQTRIFSGSAVSVASHLGRDESTIRRGYKELDESGWFVKRIQGTFNPSVYRVLNHEEWATEHPGQCVTKLEYHWTHEKDSLGQELWVTSGTRVKWQEFQIKALRRLGLHDHSLVKEFERYYQREGQRKQAKNVPAGFLMALRKKLKE